MLASDLIPYGPVRQAQMAAYAKRHYGVESATLRPKVIVLHFTDGGSWQGARNTFAADAPDLGELPGTCSHYVIDQAGVVHQLVPLTLMCRHTVGLNATAIGIEFVQNTAGHDSHWADQQILDRGDQLAAGLALVRRLQQRYHISDDNVIGHAMANRSPFFHDLEGWRNTHTDWLAQDVAVFRERLRSG